MGQILDMMVKCFNRTTKLWVGVVVTNEGFIGQSERVVCVNIY